MYTDQEHISSVCPSGVPCLEGAKICGQFKREISVLVWNLPSIIVLDWVLRQPPRAARSQKKIDLM